MDSIELRGKTIFLTKNEKGKTVPHAWDVRDPEYDKDGKFLSAGPIRAERNLSTGRVATLHDEKGAHAIRYNSQDQIIGVGDEDVRPGSLDWLNE